MQQYNISIAPLEIWGKMWYNIIVAEVAWCCSLQPRVRTQEVMASCVPLRHFVIPEE